MPDFQIEIEFQKQLAIDPAIIVGLDEVGRGPWAGPVVAAAAWLDQARTPLSLLRKLDDSKKLTATKRRQLAEELTQLNTGGVVKIALGQSSVEEIDALNILQASLLAMQRAFQNLGMCPDGALIDGNRLPELPCPGQTVIKGDSLSLSIAAASVVAKVERDRQMQQLSIHYPGYGWERNQGYGTAEHRAALLDLGVTPAHRRTFRPVRERLELSN
ncbi:ribonuclease HII [Kiloniella laminariae]|uniref:Ribonuclease HII n=1 Tax=Kiloniella laminariae TaxID=454162 RepID=A0ABT4LL20_9PROT|nr:ribonuclease HII [Kiloniella laminariae]MCZ4281812.1 ribonuclease HII [Kiloniella laminariae]